MVQLGIVNSRMKDFYDIWVLSETFAFDGAELQLAIARCFERRGAYLAAEMPDALGPRFYAETERQDLWQAYGRQGGLFNAPPNDFQEVGNRMRSFLGPVYTSILTGDTFDLQWPAAGPWQTLTRGEQREGD